MSDLLFHALPNHRLLGSLWLVSHLFACMALAEEREWPRAFEDLSSIPGIQIELAYKTETNFTGQQIYPEDARAWADSRVAHALERASVILGTQGYRLVIYDAYRPAYAVREMWQIASLKNMDLRYLSDPRNGSDHSRGAAVDVGLIQQDGSKVTMPSPFDHFGIEASHEYQGGSLEGRLHRAILRRAMQSAGFQALRDEWWHYVLPSARSNPIMDFAP